MGAYSDETHPVLPRYYDYSGGGGSYSRRRPEEECTPFCSRLLGICAAIVAALCVLGLMWYGLQSTMPPHYDIVITGVSGLDGPAASDMKRGGVLLNPVFNPTVGVASKSTLRGACIGPTI
jgi:hypothetical protein